MDDLFDYLRLMLAVAAFIAGCAGCYDLLVNGFSLIVLVAVIVCFLLAHYIKPACDKQNKPDAYDWIDVIDFVIDLPFKLLFSSIRALGKVFKNEPFDI